MYQWRQVVSLTRCWNLFAKSSVVCGVCSLIWKLSNLKWLKFGVKCINELKINESLWKLINAMKFMECSLYSKHLTPSRGGAEVDVTGMHRIERTYTAVVMRLGFGPKRLEFQPWYLVALWHLVSNLIFLNLSFLKCKWWLHICFIL